LCPVNFPAELRGTEKIISTVLIVDDDSAFRTVLRTLFDHGSGFDAFVEAENGVEAITKTKQLLPNLAVLDFAMPEMNGMQLARELKAIALSCGITAVFSKLDDLATLVANARAVCGMK
jgi:CheY-like chemotaxis protein